MKVFLDANVILDYLTDRQPFADDAETVIEFCASEGNIGKITTLTACNAVYILSKVIGKQLAEEKIKELYGEDYRVNPNDIDDNCPLKYIDKEDLRNKIFGEKL